MKKYFLMLTIFVSAILNGQNLSTIYKTGDVNLVPAADYGATNDWDKLLSGSDGRNIAVAPDGSVFMTFRNRHSISKFDKNGNFVKTFGKKGGKNTADFIYEPHLQGILNEKYIYTTAVDGRMHFFDFNGGWVKTIALKYMPLATTPMKNGNIAIYGHVPLGDGFKDIISILNFNTEKEKIINSEINSNDGKQVENVIYPYSYTDDNGKKQRVNFIRIRPKFLEGFIFRPKFTTTTDGNLVLANPKTGLVKIMDTNGKIIKEFNADIEREVITQTDRETYYNNAVKTVKDLEAKVVRSEEDKKNWDKFMAQDGHKDRVRRMLNPENYPENLPYFSEILIDSDNNILLFRFTKEEGSNKFDVYTYDSNGKKIATSRFIAEGYDLRINSALLKFYNGAIYSFLKKTDVETENSMRLVKFEVKNK